MEKIVVIGAGSTVFTRGLVRDLIEAKQPVELALVDIDPEALEIAKKLIIKMIEARMAPISITASTDRRDVLKGATVVICTIGVGKRRAWEQDVFIPRKYGIYQPVGDSVMPGGTSRALRMIPDMVAIARDVIDLAPDALFFNYGNPMAPVCRGVRKATGANMIGLCHGVFQVENYLAGLLKADKSEFSSTAVGLNHLTWFTEVRVGGKDAMPEIRTIAQRQLDRLGKPDQLKYLGVLFTEDGSVEDDAILSQEICPFSWQLLLTFGAFPAAMDRHVTEFFPQFFADGSYYGKKLGIDAFSFENCIAFGDRCYDEMRDIALSSDPLPGDFFDSYIGEHEQVIDIIDSIRNEGNRIFSVNLPNNGQVPNLPPDVIIESPAVASGSGLKPISQNPLPEGIAGTLATRLRWVETVVDAALEGSRDKFIQALVLDGGVDSFETAVKLADDLLKAQAEFLPQFKKR